MAGKFVIQSRSLPCFKSTSSSRCDLLGNLTMTTATMTSDNWRCVNECVLYEKELNFIVNDTTIGLFLMQSTPSNDMNVLVGYATRGVSVKATELHFCFFDLISSNTPHKHLTRSFNSCQSICRMRMSDTGRKLSATKSGKVDANAAIKLRSRILSAMGSIFLIAFWSYYTSFPGLNSSSGIEPVTRMMPLATPYLNDRLIATRHIDADSFCELTALLGIVLSCIVSSGWIQHGMLFSAMTCLYSILIRVSGVFYQFQWDILLLETGWLVALCYAPWTELRPKGPTTLGAWPLRFLLFKLMYMSGVVKIQADCPTWRNLTALEYHFATQCLPGPLAWHFHQLHPFLLRFSVAATLWIEIPGTILLLLTPFPCVVWIGVALQIILQVFIIVTGNYNFFNLLTIVLCLSCLELKPVNQSRRRVRRIQFGGVGDRSACTAQIVASSLSPPIEVSRANRHMVLFHLELYSNVCY